MKEAVLSGKPKNLVCGHRDLASALLLDRQVLPDPSFISGPSVL